jgi:hypothetical protein
MHRESPASILESVYVMLNLAKGKGSSSWPIISSLGRFWQDRVTRADLTHHHTIHIPYSEPSFCWTISQAVVSDSLHLDDDVIVPCHATLAEFLDLIPTLASLLCNRSWASTLIHALIGSQSYIL